MADPMTDAEIAELRAGLGFTSVRWRLFKMLSALGWWVCPEPHRSVLKATYRFDADKARDLAAPPLPKPER